MTDWILGLLTITAIIGGAVTFAHYANPFRDKIDRRRAMLRMCSWNGDGQGVHCDVCGDRLTVSNIGGMTEDGLATCYLHTKRKGARP